jgi:hypothetical protein
MSRKETAKYGRILLVCSGNNLQIKNEQIGYEVGRALQYENQTKTQDSSRFLLVEVSHGGEILKNGDFRRN